MSWLVRVPCSRFCKNGQPCGKQALPWHTYDQPGLTLPDPVSCSIHLTPTEHADLQAARERFRQAVDEYHAQKVPACWSWPVPALDDLIATSRAAHLAACVEFGFDPLPRGLDEESEACEALEAWHGGHCAVCGHCRTDLVCDHDHATGFIRGWLCRSCNIREGVADEPVLERYRQRHPAAILGVEIRYYSPFTGYAEPQPPQTNEELESSPIHALAADLEP